MNERGCRRAASAVAVLHHLLIRLHIDTQAWWPLLRSYSCSYPVRWYGFARAPTAGPPGHRDHVCLHGPDTEECADAGNGAGPLSEAAGAASILGARGAARRESTLCQAVDWGRLSRLASMHCTSCHRDTVCFVRTVSLSLTASVVCAITAHVCVYWPASVHALCQQRSVQLHFSKLLLTPVHAAPAGERLSSLGSHPRAQYHADGGAQRQHQNLPVEGLSVQLGVVALGAQPNPAYCPCWQTQLVAAAAYLPVFSKSQPPTPTVDRAAPITCAAGRRCAAVGVIDSMPSFWGCVGLS